MTIIYYTRYHMYMYFLMCLADCLQLLLVVLMVPSLRLSMVKCDRREEVRPSYATMRASAGSDGLEEPTTHTG